MKLGIGLGSIAMVIIVAMLAGDMYLVTKTHNIRMAEIDENHKERTASIEALRKQMGTATIVYKCNLPGDTDFSNVEIEMMENNNEKTFAIILRSYNEEEK